MRLRFSIAAITFDSVEVVSLQQCENYNDEHKHPWWSWIWKRGQEGQEGDAELIRLVWLILPWYLPDVP